MNNIAYFEIQATDPKRAVAFYNTIFGWEFVKEELVPIEYYRTTNCHGISGAILQRPLAPPPMQYGTNAFVCSVQVENFEVAAKLIIDNGGIVAMAKFAIPGRCWQGYFIDIDNNTFGIFQADKSAK